MKSISLYVDKDTYLTRMHPFTKLCYIFTAIVASLVAGKLWAFAAFIGISLVMLISIAERDVIGVGDARHGNGIRCGTILVHGLRNLLALIGDIAQRVALA